MQSVNVSPLVVQSKSSRDWTPARRAQAAANVERFVLEFATDPTLQDIPTRILRVAYPLHDDKKTVRAVLRLARERGWNRETLREAAKAILAPRFVRHCRGFDNRCWLHNPIVLHDHTTSHVAAVDAKGVLHVAG
jgi:hypothetical protein